MISIVSPIFRVPCFSAPPSTPPWRFFRDVPGLFMSKLLAIRKRGVSFSFGFDISILHNSFNILSRLTPCIADTGIMGEFSAIVPLTNSLIVL
mgnify:CR=1 FL=1